MGANVAESADMPDMLSVSQHMAHRENKSNDVMEGSNAGTVL